MIYKRVGVPSMGSLVGGCSVHARILEVHYHEVKEKNKLRFPLQVETVARALAYPRVEKSF